MTFSEIINKYEKGDRKMKKIIAFLFFCLIIVVAYVAYMGYQWLNAPKPHEASSLTYRERVDLKVFEAISAPLNIDGETLMNIERACSETFEELQWTPQEVTKVTRMCSDTLVVFVGTHGSLRGHVSKVPGLGEQIDYDKAANFVLGTLRTEDITEPYELEEIEIKDTLMEKLSEIFPEGG
jgi:hypothetical protein